MDRICEAGKVKDGRSGGNSESDSGLEDDEAACVQ